MSRPDMQAQRDQAYNERNRVVAALARMAFDRAQGPLALSPTSCVYAAWLGKHISDPRETVDNPWEPEWTNIVFVQLPTGQCSWHIHDSDLPLFAFLPRRSVPWDGHTTEEKYERVSRFALSQD